MSNLDNITNKIIADAQTRVDEIIEETNKKIALLRNENDLEISKIENQTMAKAEQESKSEKEKIISRASLMARDEELKSKNELLNKVFSKAKDKLSKISDDDYLKFVEKTLKQETLKGNEVLIPQAGKENLLKDIGIKVAENKTIDSGFALETDNVISNYTFDDLVDFHRTEVEGEVIGILFNGEE